MTTKTIRIFVSSTFSDLKAERNALQESVFPRLKRYCQRNGWNFEAIDLRWGISNEAAQDQSTMRICRAEIARCQAVTPRPNFVVVLGDRHGWHPLPDEIPAAEFKALLPYLSDELANRWYKLDQNAVCPLPDGTGPDRGRYILQPRTGDFKDLDKWSKEVETPLGDAFRRAVRKVNLSEDARIKYEASATAQEIYDGAFAVPDADEHVVAFIREIRRADGKPLREAIQDDASLEDFLDLKNGELDRESQDQLDLLKKKLRAHLGEKQVKTYSASWGDNGISTGHVPRLCVEVYQSLRRMIRAQIRQHSALPPLEDERLYHQEFAERRARDFTGQAELLNEIDRYLTITAEPVAPLVIHGESGSGKSALLAKVLIDLQLRNTNRKLIFRFIGATASSTDLRTLLEGLCRELGKLYGADSGDLPLELYRLSEVFRERLALARADQPLIVLLDAIDQLQASKPPELSWLPDRLPAHVRLGLSVLPGPTRDALKLRLTSGSFLELKPMCAEDADVLFQKWLHRAGRRLVQDQWEALRAAYARCSLPLYLRLTFEEVQRWRSYDQAFLPSPDVDGLIERLFSQLSEPAYHGPLLVERAISYLRCSRYGLTEDEMLDLLANDDAYWPHFLKSAEHALPMADGHETRRLPVVIWSRLYHDLEPYLSWRSGQGTALMVFFHSRFNDVADRHFLRNPAARLTQHDRLGAYFDAQPYFFESIKEQRKRAKQLPPTPRPANVRKVNELPWQRLEAAKLSRQWDDVDRLFVDLLFLESKTEAGMVFDLAGDFAQAVATLPPERPLRRLLCLLEEALRREIHFIAHHASDYPQALFQCMWNTCWWYDCPEAANHYFASTEALIGNRATPWIQPGPKLHKLLERWRTIKNDVTPDFVWVRSLRPDAQPLGGAAMGTLSVSKTQVHCLATSPDGELVAAGSGIFGEISVCELSSGRTIFSRRVGWVVTSISFSADGRRIVYTEGDPIQDKGDGSIVIVDADTYCELARLCLENDWGTSAIFLPDGARVLYARPWAKQAWIWDPVNGAHYLYLSGHEQFVMCVAVSNDGKLLASGSADQTVRLWNAVSSAHIATLQGHTDRVSCVAFSPDNRHIVSGSWDATLRVWDVQSGLEVACLRGHTARVNCVAFSPDGHHIASSGRDHIILLWTTGHYGQPSSLRGHTGAVSCVAFSQDGRYVISGSEDGYVKKWSAAGDSYFPQLIGHEDLIEQTAFSPDGRRLASASRDMTVRVWDAENGVQSLCLRGHQARVKAITFSNDGAKIASGGGNSIFEENDFSVRIWDQANGNELLRVSETADVEAIHFSPDDHRIAVATANGVSIWDASSGERVAHCGGGYALSVKYDSIGRRLIVPGGGITRILDATTGNELERAAGHKFEFEESKQIFRWQADSAAGDNPRLECTGTGQVVAWFPGTIRAVATNPAGTTWAVADMFHLRLVKLEGRSLDLG